MGVQIYDEHAPNIAVRIVADTDGTTPKVLFSPTGATARADTCLVRSDATTDTILELGMYDPSSNTQDDLCQLTIPAGAGKGAVPLFDLFGALPTPLQGGICVSQSFWLGIRATVALASGEYVTLVTFGGDL